MLNILVLAAMAAYYPPSCEQKLATVKWVKPICVEENRYIGWPTVARLANGDLLAVFSGDRDDHVCPFGKVQIVRSKDGGETWSGPKTIVDGPLDGRDAGIIVMPDGEVIVTYFTSVAYCTSARCAKHPEYAPYVARATPEQQELSLGYFRVTSKDNGETWSVPEKMTAYDSPHGPSVMGDGSLVHLGRGWYNGRCVIRCERSTDRGASWEILNGDIPAANGDHLVKDMFHEPHVLELKSGELLGMVRYHGEDNCMRSTFSKDGGKTWTAMEKTPMFGLPPHLLQMPDGRVVCVYGRRHFRPKPGEFAMVSNDGGKTWDEKNEICLSLSHIGDLGYPASVLLPDGDIVTVFYQQPERGKKPCLFAAKWRLKKGRK